MFLLRCFNTNPMIFFTLGLLFSSLASSFSQLFSASETFCVRITYSYGDKAVDDATDDDTLHAFVLHTQQAAASSLATAAVAASGSTATATSLASQANNELVPALNPSSISMSVTTVSPCMRLLRSSDLKRCLRFVATEANLWAAAQVSKAWRKAAADPRLWRITGRPEAPLILRPKNKSKA